MTSAIDMASNALLLLGEDKINALSDSDAAANLYDSTYYAALAQHPWSFALKEVELSRLTATPNRDTGYSYAFQLPSDLVRVWAVMPRTDFAIVGDLLYANQTTAFLRYVYSVEESQLPPHFVKAMEYRLAAEFALSVTEDPNKLRIFDDMANRAFAAARSIDSQGRTAVSIQHKPFNNPR